MIRFTCPHCSQHVRVGDGFAGKPGRCPFCKRVVRIPTASERAVGPEQDRPPPPPPPPPPPHAAGVTGEEGEAELVPPGDPSQDTDRLDAVTEPAGQAEQEAAAEAPAGEAPAARKAPWLLIALIGGAVVLVAAVVVAAVWFRPFGSSGKPAPRPGPATMSGRIGEEPIRPRPAPAAPAAKTQIPLSGDIQLATARAPAGSVCMFHVDLERAAGAVARIPSRSEEVVAAVAASRLWSEARERIADGSMPTSVTLFLTAEGEPVGALFGKLYGAAAAGGGGDPKSGLWSLASAESPVPHFLLRLTGPAAEHYSAELLARAEAMKLGGPLESDRPATAGQLRLAPAGMFAGEEMLVGTVKTIDEKGSCIRQRRQQQRLRELLMKVETDRSIVGCVILSGLAGRVEGALGKPQPIPNWAADDSRLVFALDPKPDGLATIVICDAAPGALAAVKAEAEPMAVRADGPDIRINGLAREGVPLIARVLPGFREVVLGGLALAGPVRRRPLPVAEKPAPKPTTQPVPEPQPKPEPQPQPVKKEYLQCVCFYEHCPTRNQPFKVEKSKVPADVIAGASPLKCPHCGKPTAVVAVQCPHCKKYYAQTLPACPYCHKPRK